MITQKRDCGRCKRTTRHDLVEVDEPLGEERGIVGLMTFGLSEIVHHAVVTRAWRCQACGKETEL